MKTTTENWLSNIDNLSQNHPLSIHLDQLEDVRQLPADSTTQEALEWVSQPIFSIKRSLAERAVSKDISVVGFVSLGTSNEISLWDDKFLTRLVPHDEAPSLYVVEGASIFESDDEEYRIHVDGIISGPTKLSTVYRSFRSREFTRRNWEFTNGIYVYFNKWM